MHGYSDDKWVLIHASAKKHFHCLWFVDLGFYRKQLNTGRERHVMDTKLCFRTDADNIAVNPPQAREALKAECLPNIIQAIQI